MPTNPRCSDRGIVSRYSAPVPASGSTCSALQWPSWTWCGRSTVRKRAGCGSSNCSPAFSRAAGYALWAMGYGPLRASISPKPIAHSYFPTMHPSRDHHLPPDPDAYRHAPHPKGRIIIIAPTRAACETIELALGIQVDTLLEREHGAELRQWAAEGKGFGIVAGTGTGKTLGIRPIAESILREPLKVGVVNREREATPETPSWN